MGGNEQASAHAVAYESRPEMMPIQCTDDLWCMESIQCDGPSGDYELDYCPSKHFDQVITRLFLTEEDATIMCIHAKELYPWMDFKPSPCALIVRSKQ